MQPISVEAFASMVMKNNKGYRKKGTGKNAERNTYCQEKRCKMYDLWRTDLGSGKCHHW
mgnify:CR=1 FL=1